MADLGTSKPPESHELIPYSKSHRYIDIDTDVSPIDSVSLENPT